MTVIRPSILLANLETTHAKNEYGSDESVKEGYAVKLGKIELELSIFRSIYG